jgi:hypothetical protein
VTEVEKRWGRLVGMGGTGALVLALGLVFWVPFELRDGIAEDRQQSSTRGLEAAPAPNLPGRLDGNSVGTANNVRRTEVVERWRFVGDSIKSGEMTRVPTEAELQENGLHNGPEETTP